MPVNGEGGPPRAAHLRSDPPAGAGPGVDRRAAHADVVLLGPEEAHTCRCPTCGDPHRAVRREVLFSGRLAHDLAAAVAGIGQHALLYDPSRLCGPGRPLGDGPLTAARLAPRLADARRALDAGPTVKKDDVRRLLDRTSVAGVSVRASLGRLLADYQAACEAHPAALVSMSWVRLLCGRPADRGPQGPFAVGDDVAFERSLVISAGKVRRRQYAGAHVLVRLLDDRELFVFPSRQWPADRAWLLSLVDPILVRVPPDAPYTEQWRSVLDAQDSTP